MISTVSRIAAVGVLVAAGSVTPAFAVVLPGIVESGAPAIVFDDTRVTVASASGGGWGMSWSGNGDFSLSRPVGDLGSPYYGEGTLRLDASFDSSGAFTGGSMSILGYVSGLNGDRKGDLFSADLTGFASTSDMLGFSTSNIVCASWLESGVGVPCTPEESIYIDLRNNFEWLGFDDLTKKKSTLLGNSITTLPVPATLPLFLTGFAVALRWMRRRPKAS